MNLVSKAEFSLKAVANSFPSAHYCNLTSTNKFNLIEVFISIHLLSFGKFVLKLG